MKGILNVLFFIIFIFILQWFNMINIKSLFLSLLGAFTFWIITDADLRENCYVIYKTLPRDLSAAILFFRFRLEDRKFIIKNKSIVEKFQELVLRHPNKICFIAENRKLTYKEVDEISTRVGRVFKNAGFSKGDVVSLFMESTPEYICIWLGLAKIGVISALINYNLRLQSLVHTVISVNSKGLIFGSNFASAIKDVSDNFNEIDCYFYGEETAEKILFAKSLNNAMAATSSEPLPAIKIKSDDHLLYIYTSGTTGLPKAVIIKNYRFFFICAAYKTILTRDDILYVTLPLYHLAGGVIGIGQAVTFGNTTVIRKKFSASQFWDDCIQHNCTVAQYLGETCRYLLAQPQKPQEKNHNIRLMLGNGLRSQLWESFVNRFGVRVFEIYGSSEGNANIINIDGKVGAVGFIPNIFSYLLPCALIKVDESTGIPLRNKDGLCIPCKRGETGEFVGKITKNVDRRFDGYVDKAATSKKIYHDVFKKGDTAFASGDVLVMDRFGYLYFKDRTGDTFRWKGENVSTSEVEDVIIKNIDLNDCVVYGVQITNCEGRAGMAAIVDSTNTVDLNKLHDSLMKQLPSYAKPLFIRMADTLPITGTFKLKKLELQMDGFDPTKCGNDKLYYLNGNKYSPLTEDIYHRICNGEFRY